MVDGELTPSLGFRSTSTFFGSLTNECGKKVVAGHNESFSKLYRNLELKIMSAGAVLPPRLGNWIRPPSEVVLPRWNLRLIYMVI